MRGETNFRVDSKNCDYEMRRERSDKWECKGGSRGDGGGERPRKKKSGYLQ
jgi:hypothetical protein